MFNPFDTEIQNYVGIDPQKFNHRKKAFICTKIFTVIETHFVFVPIDCEMAKQIVVHGYTEL